MEERYYISARHVTPIVRDLITDEEFVVLDSTFYHNISKKPIGKRIVKSMVNLKEDTRLILYR